MTEMFICECCGNPNFGLPDDVSRLSKTEQQAQCRMASEFVILNDSRYFFFGVIPLPVHGMAGPRLIGAWTELSLQRFVHVLKLLKDSAQTSAPPVPASLANQLPYHENTIGLLVTLQFPDPDSCAELQVRPCQHLLYAEQSKGISAARAAQYSLSAQRWSPEPPAPHTTSPKHPRVGGSARRMKL